MNSQVQKWSDPVLHFFVFWKETFQVKFYIIGVVCDIEKRIYKYERTKTFKTT